ncbi:MAG TPA: hypothetical protein VND64_19770 [Pirellulales bacterium]|nr:hypothetical protein [Pirellulales bacterium]
MKTIHGDQLRGHLETLVLSTLEGGEAHGLEILQRLEEAGCGLLRLKEGPAGCTGRNRPQPGLRSASRLAHSPDKRAEGPRQPVGFESPAFRFFG